MPSRIEDAKKTIIEKLRLITVANGYRNTVANVVPAIRSVDEVQEFPEIGVELGDTTLPGDKMDSGRTVYDEVTEVHVVAYLLADTETAGDPESISKFADKMESLVHDLKTCITKELLTAFASNATNRWNIELSENELRFFRDRVGLKEGAGTVGIVGTQFNVRIRAQDNTFT